MNRFRNLLVLLGVAAVIAAAAWWWLHRDDDATAKKDAEPTEKPVLMMKTKVVEKSIVDRLTARYGRQVVAECPDEVEQTVGTGFDCEVWFEDDEDTRTVAKVKMTGGGGQFSWTSEGAEDSDESDAPDQE